MPYDWRVWSKLMKIIVLSDSHGRVGLIQDVIEKEKFDKLIFLGDGLRDFAYIEDKRIIKLAGNCDFFTYCEAKEMRLELSGVKLLATHGHLYDVKRGLGGLVLEAKKKEINLVLFGHTHMSYCETIDGITFLNPGSIANGRYAIIELSNARVVKIENKML